MIINVLEKYKKWILLFIATILLIFSNGRYSNIFAPWISSALILMFTRRTAPIRGYIIISILSGIAYQITFWKFSSQNIYSILFYLPFFLGFIITVPYLIDRLFKNKFNGIIGTLVFPLVYTSIEFIYVSLSPLGSTGSLAYTQIGFLPLVQIVTITGIYGITFIITWFNSILSIALFEKKYINIKKAIFAYVIIFSIVILFGIIRILIPENSNTVKAGSFHVYDLRSNEIQNVWDNIKVNEKDFKDTYFNIFNETVNKTKDLAQSGSKIVVWSEGMPTLLYNDYDLYINNIKELAKSEKKYIVASPYIISKDLNGKATNKLIVVNDKGQIILEHIKYGGAVFDNIIKGNEILKSVNTEYGNISGLICWDADFPDIVRQEGRLNTQIIFSPAADWKEIDPTHSAPLYFRGIENGVSVLRQTMDGLSFASDSKGRYLAKNDHFTDSNWTLTANIPIKKVFSLYPYIGDLFGIIVVITFCLLIILAFFKNKSKT